jgi:hypothetical protein
MSRACLRWQDWGQECQSFPNFGSELRLDFRRRSRGLQKFTLLVPGVVRSFRRQG